MKYLVLALSVFLVACGGGGTAATQPPAVGGDNDALPEVPQPPATPEEIVITGMQYQGADNNNTTLIDVTTVIKGTDRYYLMSTYSEVNQFNGNLIAEYTLDGKFIDGSVYVNSILNDPVLENAVAQEIYTIYSALVITSVTDDSMGYTHPEYGSGTYTVKQSLVPAQFAPDAYYNIDLNIFDEITYIEVSGGYVYMQDYAGCSHYTDNFTVTLPHIYATGFESTCNAGLINHFSGTMYANGYGETFIHYRNN